MFDKIILICTGNICRSPIAEALFRARLADDKIQVASAGVAALINFPADPLAQMVMREQGYDITAHRAQQVSKPLLLATDLILALDQSHRDWLMERYPYLSGRIHKLGRWRNDADIVDPYRRPKAAFEQAYADISICTEDWVKRIKPAMRASG
jgi:protein-tyrosine phosphatase